MSIAVQGPTRSPLLFLSGLPVEANEDIIVRHLECLDKALQLKSIKLRRDYTTYASKGAATLEFMSQEQSKSNRGRSE